jgi:hypothetical protein
MDEGTTLMSACPSEDLLLGLLNERLEGSELAEIEDHVGAEGHALSVRVFQQNTPICRCLCVQTLQAQRLTSIKRYEWIDSNPKNHSLIATSAFP